MQNLEDKSPDLEKSVAPGTPMKDWLLEYVGNIAKHAHNEHRKEMEQAVDHEAGTLEEFNGEITVEMIIEVMADEFPEFLMAIAEENWIRGYHQALTDVEEGEKLYKKEMEALEGGENVTEE